MIKNIIPICLFALGLTACGGGGSSDTSNTGANVINASAMNGIYVGEGSESGFGTFELIAFIQGGQIRAVADTGVGYSGALTAKKMEPTKAHSLCTISITQPLTLRVFRGTLNLRLFLTAVMSARQDHRAVSLLPIRPQHTSNLQAST
jgi:hypothetical protein